MALVTPNEGQLELLSLMLIDTGLTTYDYLVDLYQNNYTPNQGSSAVNFTIANFTGYVQKSFLRSGWTAPTTVSNQAVTTYSGNPLSWVCGATTNTIYGYLVRSSVSGAVLFAEDFGSGIVLNNGLTFQLNLNFSAFGQNP